MTLEEAISHAREVACKGTCPEQCAQDHMWLADRLEELQAWRRNADHEITKRLNEMTIMHVHTLICKLIEFNNRIVSRQDCYAQLDAKLKEAEEIALQAIINNRYD